MTTSKDCLELFNCNQNKFFNHFFTVDKRYTADYNTPELIPKMAKLSLSDSKDIGMQAG